MKHFATCFNSELEGFILCQRRDLQIKSKIPKKGKLKDAEEGKNNMIRIAWES